MNGAFRGELDGYMRCFLGPESSALGRIGVKRTRQPYGMRRKYFWIQFGVTLVSISPVGRTQRWLRTISAEDLAAPVALSRIAEMRAEESALKSADVF